MNILGLSFFYHDSSATLLKDGAVTGAVQEERFSRKKHDNRFPFLSVRYLLESGGLKISDIDRIVYYENPALKLSRIIYSFASYFPSEFKMFSKIVESQAEWRLRIKKVIRKETGYKGKIEIIKHHESHAASAFYPSPFSQAAFWFYE